MTTDDYVALLTSEHRIRPRLQAVVRAFTEAFADTQTFLASLIDAFDLDIAIGVQLDAIGKWVGISRQVAVTITDVYFTWDGTVETGWSHGFWKGPFDPASGIVNLDDDSYRSLIRAKILADHWDGTTETLCEFYDSTFGAGVVKVTDNQDMSITLTYTASALNAVETSLLTNGTFGMKPEGVSINYIPA